ncbi:ATP-binding protein [Nitratifractor salsuginis]|uniref:Transcriptional regulator n=1 Tax=Nitratifractor salsuginis (strain DSM 16511 / JCM 12458 / E9I37-1) TaxID=749222 RepID=E6WYN0_NITSE|nr:ATP-binding protein [Nitratifractor salsuginis]ADV45401.1 putative transcriptional regulator [Nitratifractor salsuginis DSM 16511]
MNETELLAYLKQLCGTEDEKCEHKEFSRLRHALANNAGKDIVSYVSALANMEGGILLIGVKDGLSQIVGIDDTSDLTPQRLPQRLCELCTNLSTERLSVDEYITSDTEKKVWVLHVPRHCPRKPVYAHKKAWQRNGESLIGLTQERERVILAEPMGIADDWSMAIVEEASIDDLSQEAITVAREEYKTKHPGLALEVEGWDDATFLNKAKLAIGGRLTRAALLLLGKEESSHLLAPAVPQISWVLKDEEGVEQGYEHFGLPILLSARKVHEKIRNHRIRYMSESKLFPEEVQKYDPWVIYEALHNCIAHQDYELGGRINVVEFPDRLVISNLGSFIPGSVENVIRQDAPPERYRNPFLSRAMVEINMIDTIGSGIRRIFSKMKQRYFPMPDYRISPERVEVTIYGRILDERYSELLARDNSLTLEAVIALDRIAKKLPVDRETIKELRSAGLVEGRVPNLYISAKVAQATGEKAKYTRYRGMDKQYYFDLIVKGIQQHGFLTRKDIDDLLTDKLPDYMNEKQRRTKISNLINELSNKLEKICNEGSDRSPKWVLCEDRDITNNY